MRFLLDQNVPESVAQVLEGAGHDVIRLRDIVPTDSPDAVVATAGEIEEAVLVSSDGDFDKIAPRVPDGQRRRFRRLSRITLKCHAPNAARRASVALTLIEFEFDLAKTSNDPRMQIVLGDSYIRTNR